jgi:hypothetical protein
VIQTKRVPENMYIPRNIAAYCTGLLAALLLGNAACGAGTVNQRNCPAERSIAGACVTPIELSASEQAPFVRYGALVCADGYAYSSVLQRCESKHSGRRCKAGHLVRSSALLGCFQEPLLPATPWCLDGRLLQRGKCRLVSNGQQVDLALWLGILSSAGTPSNQAFCATFLRNRLDLDLRAARVAKFALRVQVAGNDLSRATVEGRALAYEDQPALDRTLSLYLASLQALGRVSSVSDLEGAASCTVPASSVPLDVEPEADAP